MKALTATSLVTACSLALATLCALAMPEASAQSRSSEDLQGVWWNAHPVRSLVSMAGGTVPFTPTGKALYAASQRALAAETAQPLSRNSVKRCLPLGPTRIVEQPYPMQIIQKGSLVVMLYELNHVYEMVYLDEPSDTDRDPAFMGNSVGQWTSQGLRVTTTSLKTGTLLDDSGLPHSNQLTLERLYRRSDHGRELEIITTISDPVMFQTPWQVRQVLVRRPDLHIEEYTCGQGPTLEDRYTRASAKP